MTTKTVAQITKLQQEIMLGRFDGHLVDITDSIAERLRSGEPRLLWRITLDGESWSAETVTVGELRYVETVTGQSYLSINPGVSMGVFTALVTAHYKTQGLDQNAALAKADAITQAQAIDAIEMYEGSLGKGSGSPTS